MKQIYKLTVLMVVFMLFGINSIAQDSLSVTSLQKDNSASTWHLFMQQGAVKIYYQYVDNGPGEFINFKVENTSNQAVTIAWNFTFYKNGVALNSNPDDVNITMTVGASSSEAGVCFSNQNIPLNIFVREANQSYSVSMITINNFSITN